MLIVIRIAFIIVFIISTFASVGAEPRLRRPNAVTVIGDTAFVANRESGSLSVVNIPRQSVSAEFDIGQQLADIVACPDNRHLLAVDEGAARLLVLQLDDGDIKVKSHVGVPPYPVTISLSPDGKQCAVASLWPRQVTLFDTEPLLDDSPAARRIVDLKIAPRTQCWLNKDRLAVADSFGGVLTIIDTKEALPKARLKLEGHNIRGLALNGDRTHLFVTHQILNAQEPTERQRVFWGDVMGNLLRTIALTHIDELCDSSTLGNEVPEHRIAHWMFHPLGEPSNAAGDPGVVLVNERGQTAVLLSGTNEVAMRAGDHKVFTRRTVGRRPVAGALTNDGDAAVVANYFDDSVSFISLTDKSVDKTISLGEQPPLTLEQIGEVAFFNAHLSLDNWYSCHSCHTDGHTNGQLNDNFGDDSYGAPKRILSLLGVSHTAPWAWNGSQERLRDQVSKSIKITMQGQATDEQREQVATAITAYLDTLKPPPPTNRLRGVLDAASVERGKHTFHAVGCTECHVPDQYTIDDTFAMGIVEDHGPAKFNPPSLVGLSQREFLLHNASARSVTEVFQTTNHGKLTESLNDQEIEDLKTFLSSL